LGANQVRNLARLGLKVQKHFGGLPQDIEWAVRDGRFQLLQSRPVTGIEFSWDAEVNAWQKTPEDDDVVWTKAGADEWWTGAITPLMFSYRAELWQRAHDHNAQIIGIDEGIWFWKYHRAEAYFNTKLHRLLTERACPPIVRSLMLPQLAPDDREAATAAPFSHATHLRKYLQMELSLPTRSCSRWFSSLDRMLTTEKARGFEMLALDLTELTDQELVRHIEECIDHEYYYYDELWIPMWIFGRDASGLLGALVSSWYDGDNVFAGVELTSGVPKRTITQIENRRLWELSQRIRTEPPLRDTFEAAEDGADFLSRLERHEAGRAYLEDYRAFVAEFGHRGGADRDLYYAKRAEDPSIDLRAMRSLLSVSAPVDPEVKEAQVNARREEVLDEVLANVRRKPLGSVRAELFKVVHRYVLNFIMARDNERELADLWSYVHKLGYRELGRRLIERGILEAEDDHYFLTKQSLYALLDGDVRDRHLLRAKITARRRDFEGFLRRTMRVPDYIYRNAPLDYAAKEQQTADGVLTGTGTSRGTVTGRARVLHGVEQIGRVEEGDIVICHATDPGWTPVFMVISGLVLETGGLLAHGSCLSREYGLPCVQVPGATTLVPDGAMITISGDSGRVRVEQP
jgi:pyruvate,water dikinase